MPRDQSQKIVNGVSTSVLFDMSEPDRVFKEDGEEAYIRYMLENADKRLPLSERFEHLRPALEASDHTETIIISRNSPLTSRRAIRTLLDEGVAPEKMVFTSGRSPVPFLNAYGIDHFRTTNYDDAVEAYKSERVFSTFYDVQTAREIDNPQLEGEVTAPAEEQANVLLLPSREKREASLKPVYDKQTISDYIFDLDGVVLGPESEKFFQEHGLEAYMNYQKAMGHVPSSEGPALGILRKASAINQSYAGHTKPFNNHCVTAQGLWAAIRSIETFHAWGVDFNGTTHFLAGNDKLPVLKVLREQARQSGRSIEFYDDQRRNVEKGREAGILSGQVLDPDELHSS
ncbi:MAG: 5'-nucleotidase [Alphaproteobacteria bacterium]|nr:5'-nucleotidase [Alphaproteobacteria bacterium]